MRCLSCNSILNVKEATRRSVTTDEFVDLCDHCLRDVDIDTYTQSRFEDNNDTEDYGSEN